MAKKNVNYKAILKDGLILMIAGLVFAFVFKFGFDYLRGEVKENAVITAILQDDSKKIGEVVEKSPELLNEQDEQGRTPLMWASYLNYGDRELVFKKGKTKDENGKEIETPSLEEKRFAIAKLFVDKKADLELKDEDGWTALIWASWTGMPTVVDLLIKNGADVNALDNQKQSALMIASQRGNDKVVELLINAGADKTLKNATGKGAEDLANEYMVQFSSRKENYEAVIKALKAEPKPVETPAEEVKEEPKAEEAAEAAPAEAEAKPAEEAKAEEAAPAEEVKEAPKEEAAPAEAEAKPAEEKPAE
ncbi:ankyrin repeat domain-containing protein [bacterium]|nr:ankyrin repeat domain-containing protein [bacterium]